LSRIETRLKKIIETSRVNELDEPVTIVNLNNDTGLYTFKRNNIEYKLNKDEFDLFIKKLPKEVSIIIDDIPED